MERVGARKEISQNTRNFTLGCKNTSKLKKMKLFHKTVGMPMLLVLAETRTNTPCSDERA